MADGRRRVVTLLIAVAAVSSAAVACGGDSGGSPSTTAAAGGSPAQPKVGNDYRDETASAAVSVQAKDNVFDGQFIEITKGTTVTFTNDGRNRHNVLPDRADEFTAIETDQFDPGMTGQITFDETGEFRYYCSLHGTPTKGMFGAIKVVD